MGAFSDRMRVTAKALCEKYGNKCTLEKITYGEYDPSTGETSKTVQTLILYSAPVASVSEVFSRIGENTNLSGFSNDSYIVPWPGQKLDTTWTYDGQNILTIAPVEAQDDVIIYNITVGEKNG